jgi:hypothetical protein
MRGGNKYLTRRKAKHFGFLIQILFSIWSVGFLKLLGGMPKAWILNCLLMFALGFFRYIEAGE